jgi:lipopolysaccharide export LptBFGC system permease protein LptF
MVLAGLSAGFTFFILNYVSKNLGTSGFAAPEVAAWAPAGIAGLLALTVLLHQEDG